MGTPKRGKPDEISPGVSTPAALPAGPSLGSFRWGPDGLRLKSGSQGPDRSYRGHGGATQGFSHLVQSIESAPWAVPYEGLRKVQYLDEVPSLSYRERVAGDGQGGFQLELDEMLSSHPNLNGIAQRLEQTKAFRYRYKDFRIQDSYLFQLAYRVRILTKDEVVAGVACTRILVEENQDDPSIPLSQQANHFLVDFDPVTGLVLQWQELDSQATLVASMVFESIQYGAPTMGMHPTAFRQTELPKDSDLNDAVGFEVLRPTLLPENFRLDRATFVEDGSNPWVRQVYSDGLKVIILQHRGQVLQAGSPGNSSLGAIVDGNRTMLMGSVNGFEIIAEGDQDLDTMQDVVGSCFQ